MEEITKDNMFVEFDKKTGIGDLLFVNIEPDIMHYRFCRIRDNVKECFFLEFDDRDNNQYQIFFFKKTKANVKYQNVCNGLYLSHLTVGSLYLLINLL